MRLKNVHHEPAASLGIHHARSTLIKFFLAQRITVKHSELNRITLISWVYPGWVLSCYMEQLTARVLYRYARARARGLNGSQYQSDRLLLGRNVASELPLSITD